MWGPEQNNSCWWEVNVSSSWESCEFLMSVEKHRPQEQLDLDIITN
jgi:hypothetical protein